MSTNTSGVSETVGVDGSRLHQYVSLTESRKRELGDLIDGLQHAWWLSSREGIASEPPPMAALEGARAATEALIERSGELYEAVIGADRLVGQPSSPWTHGASAGRLGPGGAQALAGFGGATTEAERAQSVLAYAAWVLGVEDVASDDSPAAVRFRGLAARGMSPVLAARQAAGMEPAAAIGRLRSEADALTNAINGHQVAMRDAHLELLVPVGDGGQADGALPVREQAVEYLFDAYGAEAGSEMSPLVTWYSSEFLGFVAAADSGGGLGEPGRLPVGVTSRLVGDTELAALVLNLVGPDRLMEVAVTATAPSHFAGHTGADAVWVEPAEVPGFSDLADALAMVERAGLLGFTGSELAAASPRYEALAGLITAGTVRQSDEFLVGVTAGVLERYEQRDLAVEDPRSQLVAHLADSGSDTNSGDGASAVLALLRTVDVAALLKPEFAYGGVGDKDGLLMAQSLQAAVDDPSTSAEASALLVIGAGVDDRPAQFGLAQLAQEAILTNPYLITIERPMPGLSKPAAAAAIDETTIDNALATILTGGSGHELVIFAEAIPVELAITLFEDPDFGAVASHYGEVVGRIQAAAFAHEEAIVQSLDKRNKRISIALGVGARAANAVLPISRPVAGAIKVSRSAIVGSASSRAFPTDHTETFYLRSLQQENGWKLSMKKEAIIALQDEDLIDFHALGLPAAANQTSGPGRFLCGGIYYPTDSLVDDLDVNTSDPETEGETRVDRAFEVLRILDGVASRLRGRAYEDTSVEGGRL